MTDKPNGYTIILRSDYTSHGDGDNLILAYSEEKRQFVTAWYRPGASEWSLGSYFAYGRPGTSATAAEALKKALYNYDLRIGCEQ